MAATDSPIKPLPRCVITRSGQDTVVFAEDSEAFRAGCAAEAVSQAVALLNVLRREFNPSSQSDYSLCVVFETTMRRVRELLDSVNIGHLSDEAVDDNDIGDVVFGEGWLVGMRQDDGRVVPDFRGAEVEASHG